MKHTMTRTVCLMLAVIMVLSMAAFPVNAANGYVDVDANQWYASAVNYVTEKGYMNGVDDNHFDPEGRVTRAMFVTVLARLSQADLDDSVTVFDDVPANEWYTGAVTWAAENGIVNGVSASQFAPNRNITRQDMCTMISRFIERWSYRLETVSNPAFFRDSSKIASYAKTAVRACADAGLIEGFEDDTFKPKGVTSRAQLAKVIMLLAEDLDGQIVKPVIMPAQSFAEDAGEDMSISVEAPKGALPEDTEMTVSRVTDEAALAALQAKVSGELVAAADITFKKDGEELEPSAAVEVELQLDGLENLKNPVVYHINENGVAEPVFDQQTVSLNRSGSSRALRFYAKSFSVYAVVEQPIVESARMTVNFIYLDVVDGQLVDKNICTVFVKNGDSRQELNRILYEPGLGSYSLGTDEVFVGWAVSTVNTTDARGYDQTTPRKTIENIRDAVSEMTIVDGSVLNIYAEVLKVYHVVYKEKSNIVIGSDNVLLVRTEDEAAYTVDMPYVDPDETAHFEGWNTADVGNITELNGSAVAEGDLTGATCFPNESKLVIKGNITFTVDAPKGYWLVFNENGKGATYNAPIFQREGLTTNCPELAEEGNMVRPGYTFGGWFKDEACTEGQEFSFPVSLTQNTEIYAKWTLDPTVHYTVNVWKQCVKDKHDTEDNKKTYDFVASISFDVDTAGITELPTIASLRSDISAYTGLAGNSAAAINGETYDFYGFKLNVIRTSDAGDGTLVTQAKDGRIQANGATTINVYYDREIVTYSFFTQQTGYTYTRVNNPNYNSTNYYVQFDDGQYYACSRADRNSFFTFTVDGTTYRAPTIVSATETNTGYTTSNTRNLNTSTTNYYIKINGQYYNLHYNNGFFGIGSYWYYYTDSGSEQNISNITSTAIYQLTNITYKYNVFYTRGNATTGWFIDEDYGVFTGLYGQRLIEADESYDWPTDYRWFTSSSNNATGFNSVVDSFQASVSGTSVTNDPFKSNFYGRTFSSDAYVYHYLMDTEGNYPSDPTYSIPTVQGNGMTFRTFPGFTAEKYRVNIGRNTNYTVYEVGAWNSSTESYTLTNGVSKNTGSSAWTDFADADHYITWSGDEWADGYHVYATEGGIEMYYARDKFNLNFRPGRFENGDGSVIEDPGYSVSGEVVEDIYYNASLASYKNKTPAVSGGSGTSITDEFVFMGWYADEACTEKFDFETTNMANGGTTVFAKYVQKQYRAFLHPNVPTTDGSLFWGSSNQKMNFRVAYGDKLSMPTGTRDNYTMVGWFIDPGFNTNYNAGFVFNDKNVTAAYSKDPATEYTDQTKDGVTKDIGRYGLLDEGWTGVNGDEDRDWITRKLDLYCLWRKVLEGADGIDIQYVSETGSAPDDPFLYQDQAVAIAETAPSTAPEGKQFMYWIVQTWNGTAFENAKDDQGKEVYVYAGGEFRVEEKYCHKEDNGVDEQGKQRYTYTLQLKAYFDTGEQEEPTHITWVGNGGEHEGDPTFTYGNLTINEAVDILPADFFTSPNGGTFLGWARLTEDECKDDEGNWITRDDLSVSNLWLTYHPAEVTETADPDAADGNHAVITRSRPAYYTVDIDGVEKTVEQVAADEKTDMGLHVLYAVWADECFIYHSSDGTIEAIKPGKAATIDLTAYVKTGCLYGGYFMDKVDSSTKAVTLGYGGVSAENLEVGKYEALSQKGETRIGTVPEALQYTGEFLFSDGTNAPAFEEVDGVRVQTNRMLWSYTQGQTASGKSVTPTVGAVYYLKEVPADYLPNKLVYTYYALHTEQITDIYLISAIDDATYNNCGFLINGTAYQYGALANSFTLKVTGWGEDEERLNYDAPKLNNALKRGYVAVLELGEGFVEAGRSFTVQPVWKTIDGVGVAAPEITYTISADLKGISGTASGGDSYTPIVTIDSFVKGKPQ